MRPPRSDRPVARPPATLGHSLRLDADVLAEAARAEERYKLGQGVASPNATSDPGAATTPATEPASIAGTVAKPDVTDRAQAPLSPHPARRPHR